MAEELLAGSPIFAGLSASTTATLRSSLVPRSLARGETVYLRGDDPEAFYGILTGRVRFSAAAPDGKELVVDYAEAGRWFGEIGLFDDGPRVVDALAAEPTELLVLARRAMLSLCRSDPELPLRMLAHFTARIRRAEDIITEATFLALPVRMARRLLVLAEDVARVESVDGAPAVRIAQDELGRLTGVTRESVGKQLKSWEREGTVRVVYGRVVLLEVERLRRLVAAAVG